MGQNVGECREANKRREGSFWLAIAMLCCSSYSYSYPTTCDDTGTHCGHALGSSVNGAVVWKVGRRKRIITSDSSRGCGKVEEARDYDNVKLAPQAFGS